MTNSDDADRESRTVGHEPGDPIGLEQARYPYERVRLIIGQYACLAVVVIAVILIIEASKINNLLWYVLLAIVTFILVILTLQLRRARLLGSAVRVTPESLPELHAEMTYLRKRLNYWRPVDVYVAESVNDKVMLTGFLWQRVILLDGDFMASLDDEIGSLGRRVVLGRLLGTLKARHAGMELGVFFLQAVDLLKFTQPLLMPYYRATTFTGDQIGYLCANDLNATLDTMVRQLAGKDLIPDISKRGLIEQAAQVQEEPLPRLAELVSSTPHIINRYLNVIAFAAKSSSRQFEGFRDGLDEKTKRRLDALLKNTPHQTSATARRDSPVTWIAAIVYAVIGVLMTVGLHSCSNATKPHIRTPNPFPSDSAIPGAPSLPSNLPSSLPTLPSQLPSVPFPEPTP